MYFFLSASGAVIEKVFPFGSLIDIFSNSGVVMMYSLSTGESGYKPIELITYHADI